MEIEGPPGESVLYCAWVWLLPGEMEEVREELEAYWAHYEDLTDERAIVLVGALCVEDCLDRMISAFFPASKILHENRDFTFSLKIDILQACSLIPRRILHHCDLIRSLRNDFAHNLDFQTLSDLGDTKLRNMDQGIKSYQADYDFSVPYRQRFEDLVRFTCIALKVYTTQVQPMRAFIDSEDFLKSLQAFAEKENVA